MKRCNQSGKYPEDDDRRQLIRDAASCLQAAVGEGKLNQEHLVVAARRICDAIPVLKDPKPASFSLESGKTFPYWVNNYIIVLYLFVLVLLKNVYGHCFTHPFYAWNPSKSGHCDYVRWIFWWARYKGNKIFALTSHGWKMQWETTLFYLLILLLVCFDFL